MENRPKMTVINDKGEKEVMDIIFATKLENDPGVYIFFVNPSDSNSQIYVCESDENLQNLKSVQDKDKLTKLNVVLNKYFEEKSKQECNCDGSCQDDCHGCDGCGN